LLRRGGLQKEVKTGKRRGAGEKKRIKEICLNNRDAVKAGDHGEER